MWWEGLDFLRRIYVRRFYVGRCSGREDFFYIKATYVDSTWEDVVGGRTFST